MLPEIDIQAMQALRDKMGDLDGTVRVVKHELANSQQAALGRDIRFDKFEERTRVQFEEMRKETTASFDRVNDTITRKFDDLSAQFSTLNIKQEKGASFYAGIAAVMTFVITVIMGLAKILFGGGA